MIFLRPARKDDVKAVCSLADKSLIGITTLPKDHHILEQRVLRSCESFAKNVTKPGNELYLFVAEDAETRSVVGIGGVAATTGQEGPLYFYRKEFYETDSELEKVPKTIPVITPVSYVHGTSEMCSLFVLPEWRKHGVGTLASLSRFLFIAAHPKRFTASLYAELRGIIASNNTSPFWEGVGKKFFHATFEEALNLLKYGRNFIPEFLPKYPIYVDLLPREVTEVIGKPHPETRRAQEILFAQGFGTTDLIDIFDGGPKVQARRDNVVAISSSKVSKIKALEQEIEPLVHAIVTNERLDFRACFAPIRIGAKGYVTLGKQTAEVLEVSLNDAVRIYIL